MAMRILDGEQGGLRVGGLIQRRGPAGLGIEHVQQRFGQLAAEDFRAAIECLAEDGLRVVEPAAHAHVLRALSGKEQADARPQGDADLTGFHVARRGAIMEGLQLLLQLLAVVGHDRQAMVEVRAARGGREAEIAEQARCGFRGGQQPLIALFLTAGEKPNSWNFRCDPPQAVMRKVTAPANSVSCCFWTM